MTTAYTQIINNTKDLVFYTGSTPLGNISKSYGSGCTVYTSNADGTVNGSGNYVTVINNAGQLYTALYSDVTQPTAGTAPALREIINGYIGGSTATITAAYINAVLGLSPNEVVLTDASGNLTTGSVPGSPVLSFNTRTGAVTLTSLDVTTALGFTPGQGTVTSVTGTSNRITSTGGATPAIDISASYVGQSSITTLGTIGTGVWNAGAVTSSGAITANATTLATSTTVGSLVTAGGLSVAKNIWLGANLTTTSTTTKQGVYFNMPAATYTDNTTSASLTIMAAHSMGVPSFVGSSLTVTSAAALYLDGDPIVSGVLGSPPTYAFYNNGKSNLVGAVTMGSTLNTTGLLTASGGLTTSGAITLARSVTVNANGATQTVSTLTTTGSTNTTAGAWVNQFIVSSGNGGATGGENTTAFTSTTGTGMMGMGGGACPVFGLITVTGTGRVNNSNNAITAAQNFCALTSFSNSGSIVDNVGFRTQTHVTTSTGTITGNNEGFRAENQTLGATIIGFRSRVAVGAGKYGFYEDGGAQSGFTGKLGAGTLTPSFQLHVNGTLGLLPTTSNAASLTLGASTSYVFTGTTTTWTLPAASSTTAQFYMLKNRGSGAITLNANAGAPEIYNISAVTFININPGEAYILHNDGTYWCVM